MKKAICCVLISMLLLSGCVPEDDSGTLQIHIAEKAQVICENCPDLTSCSYQEDKDVGALLLYIRSLGPLPSAMGPANPPDARAATMIFSMADGSQRTYRQRGNDYLRVDHGPWLQIPKGRGVHLWQLLSDMAKGPDK